MPVSLIISGNITHRGKAGVCPGSQRACVGVCVYAEGDEWVRKKRLVLPLVRTPRSGRVKSYPGGKDESIVGLVAGKFFALPTA